MIGKNVAGRGRKPFGHQKGHLINIQKLRKGTKNEEPRKKSVNVMEEGILRREEIVRTRVKNTQKSASTMSNI